MASASSSSGMLSRLGDHKLVVSKQGLVLCWGEVSWGDASEAGYEPDLTEGERGTG